MTDHFGDCLSLVGSNETALIECVSLSLQREENARNDDLKKFLFIIAGSLIFFMQAGFAMLCAGSVRIKNVQNTMLKNLLDACGAAISFYVVGYAFAFGGNDDSSNKSFIGTSEFASVGSSAAFWFFQYTFSATSVTIVAGTLAERCQMAAYMCYSVFLAGFVYPVVAHAIWSNGGFLSGTTSDPFLDAGVVDFAGSGVVHLTGGTTALYATWILGPRRGRFYDAQGEPLETPKPFPGHSVALQMLGTMILWFGWFGFNPGSALLLSVPEVGEVAATAAVSTALAGAMGGISALFTNLWLEERRTGEPSFSITMCMNGCLGGLVAITSGCALMGPWAAIIVGIVAGWLYIWSSAFLIKIRIDDAVDAIPVHMVNGIWGLIATGFMAEPALLKIAGYNDAHAGWFYSLANGSTDAALLCNQFVACLFICSWTFALMFPFFIWLNYMGWLRADSLEELVGLDISYHGGVSGGSRDSVKKEYIEAYKRHKGGPSSSTPRRRRGGDSSGGGTARWHDSSVSEGDRDPEVNPEAAMEEAMVENDSRHAGIDTIPN